MEAICEHHVSQRTPKKLIDMDEEELYDAIRIARARIEHETTPATVKTSIANATQFGFGFMKDDFRVKEKTK